MSSQVGGLGDARLRRALRNLDKARFNLRLGRGAVAASIGLVGATIYGWYALISWGLVGFGQVHVNKGGVVFGGVVGLLLLTAGVAAASVCAVLFWYDVHEKRVIAQEVYEDLVMELAS